MTGLPLDMGMSSYFSFPARASRLSGWGQLFLGAAFDFGFERLEVGLVLLIGCLRV